MLIVGCVGLGLNVFCMLVVHGAFPVRPRSCTEHGGHGHGSPSAKKPEDATVPAAEPNEQLLVELNRIQVPGYGFSQVDVRSTRD